MDNELDNWWIYAFVAEAWEINGLGYTQLKEDKFIIPDSLFLYNILGIIYLIIIANDIALVLISFTNFY